MRRAVGRVLMWFLEPLIEKRLTLPPISERPAALTFDASGAPLDPEAGSPQSSKTP
jgi:hypothetical protein